MTHESRYHELQTKGEKGGWVRATSQAPTGTAGAQLKLRDAIRAQGMEARVVYKEVKTTEVGE